MKLDGLLLFILYVIGSEDSYLYRAAVPARKNMAKMMPMPQNHVMLLTRAHRGLSCNTT